MQPSKPSPIGPSKKDPPALASVKAFGYPRYFHGNRSVYTVISPRARGLSIGVNLNKDRYCNFDCVYCEVAGSKPASSEPCNVDQTTAELENILALAHNGGLKSLPCYESVPDELLALREVTLSGDGEPTLCPNFSEVVASVIRVRAISHYPFFKIVLITNATGLQRPDVQVGLKMFTDQDEIWAKLDAGTQAWMNRINHPGLALEDILANIQAVGQSRPVIIQSLFPQFQNAPPPPQEIEAYISRLNELTTAGTHISLVQIYSSHRPTSHLECDHLPLRTLSQIARRVRENTGLTVEVY